MTPRPRKDGTTGYTAQIRIRIKRNRHTVYTTAKTCDKAKNARARAKRKEWELIRPAAPDAAGHPSATPDTAIDKNLEASRREVGRRKALGVDAIRRNEIAAMA